MLECSLRLDVDSESATAAPRGKEGLLSQNPSICIVRHAWDRQ
jgi:hypothetical protein